MNIAKWQSSYSGKLANGWLRVAPNLTFGIGWALDMSEVPHKWFHVDTTWRLKKDFSWWECVTISLWRLRIGYAIRKGSGATNPESPY